MQVFTVSLLTSFDNIYLAFLPRFAAMDEIDGCFDSTLMALLHNAQRETSQPKDRVHPRSNPVRVEKSLGRKFVEPVLMAKSEKH